MSIRIFLKYILKVDHFSELRMFCKGGDKYPERSNWQLAKDSWMYQLKHRSAIFGFFFENGRAMFQLMDVPPTVKGRLSRLLL